jgi:hypothetical protein
MINGRPSAAGMKNGIWNGPAKKAINKLNRRNPQTTTKF